MNTDVIADPRWMLEVYAPDLHALIKMAPDLEGLAELSESVLTALQEAVRDRYKELATAEMLRGHVSH
jgi:hypothetical protein